MTESARHPHASDDLEVSSYLEIAEERVGRVPQTPAQPKPVIHDSVVVVDFGSQYSMLIARRIRECRVYCDVVSYNVDWDTVAVINPKAVILSGGPASVYSEGAPKIPSWVFEKGLPVLGICYGMQALADELGGE